MVRDKYGIQGGTCRVKQRRIRNALCQLRLRLKDSESDKGDGNALRVQRMGGVSG